MRQKLRIRWKALKMEIKEHKSSFVVYMVLRALVILVMILQILNRNYEDVFYCVLTLLLLIVPSFLQVGLKIDLPMRLLFYCLYFRQKFWGRSVHIIRGFLTGIRCFIL